MTNLRNKFYQPDKNNVINNYSTSGAHLKVQAIMLTLELLLYWWFTLLQISIRMVQRMKHLRRTSDQWIYGRK